MSSHYIEDKDSVPQGIVKRILTLTDGTTERQVEHLQMNTWPDKKAVPDSQKHCLQYLIDRGLEVRKNPKDMIVVHCSAGIGRTGTYIALMLIIESI